MFPQNLSFFNTRYQNIQVQDHEIIWLDTNNDIIILPGDRISILIEASSNRSRDTHILLK
jgi:hypothetical protein